MKMFGRVRLNEVAFIKGGKRLPLGEEFSREPTSHPYIRARDIGNGPIRIQDAVYLSDDMAQRLSRYRVSKGDVCITIVGANVGEMGFVPPELHDATLTENAVRVRSNGKVVQGYLQYALSSQDALAQMKVLAGGAAQPKLGIYKIETIEIPFPTLATQRKVAAILSAYDDLIENNLRRIKILEDLAQNLYREWFVKFRFPDCSRVPFRDSPVGTIPEVWETTILGDYCELVMGQSPKSEFYNERGEGLPFHQGVTGFGDRFPTDKIFCTITERTANEGDILLSVRAPVGRINVALHRLVIGRGVAAIRARNRHQFFLLHHLKEVFSEEDSMGNGAIFKAVTKSDLMGITLVIPAPAILAEFDEIAQSIGLQIRVLTAKSNTLRRTRDLLLPRLISGELDVSDLDIMVPAEAVP